MTEEPDKKDTVAKKPRKSGRKRGLRNWSLALIAVFVLLPSVLYIPAVQRYVTGVICENVEEATGYEVEIGQLSLKFPFRFSLADVLVKDEHRDTLISGRHMEFNVRLYPLLAGRVELVGLDLQDGYYRMVSEDSAMTLVARLHRFQLMRTDYGLLSNHIDVSSARLDKADVSLMMDARRSKTQPEDTTSSTSPLLITLNQLDINDITYTMAMMPTIDTLKATVKNGRIEGVNVNLANNLAKVKTVDIKTLSADYWQPTAAAAEIFAKQIPADTVVTATMSEPWTVVVDRFSLSDSRALYATRGVRPSSGFDAGYIEVDSVNIEIDDLYNRGTILRVPLTKLTANERCGVKLRNASGLFAMDDKTIRAEGFNLSTDGSAIKVDAELAASALSGDEDAALKADVETTISLDDAGKIMPLLKPMWSSLGEKRADLKVSVGGTMRRLAVNEVRVAVPGVVDVGMKGTFTDALQPDLMAGKMDIDGRLTGGNYLKKTLGLTGDINVPPVSVKGTVDYRDQTVDGRATATVAGGRMVADGRLNMKRESYDAQVRLAGFNVASVLPTLGVGTVDADVTADGRGYDPYTMTATLLADIANVEYDGVSYQDISLAADLDKGQCTASITSDDEKARLNLDVDGSLTPDVYKMKIDGRIDNVDLVAMKVSTERLAGGMDVTGEGVVDFSEDFYAGYMRLSNLFILLPNNTFRTDSIDCGFASNPTETRARVRNNDMTLKFFSPLGVRALASTFGSVLPDVDSMLLKQRLDLVKLNSKLPRFTASFNSKDRNIVRKYIAGTGTTYDGIDLTIDKAEELKIDGRVEGLTVSGVKFDALTLDSRTESDSLLFNLAVANEPDNMELLKSASLAGTVSANRATLYVTQVDKFDEKGFDFGLHAEVNDSILTAGLYPLNPRIASLDWSINQGNFVTYDMSRNQFRADLSIRSGLKSKIDIYTDRDSLFHKGLNVDLAGINLRDWLVLSPFAPPIEGELSGMMKVNFNDKFYWGDAQVRIEEMRYGKRRVGDVDLDAKLAMTDDAMKTFALGNMKIDGDEFMTLKGYKNDSLPESEYNLDLELKRMPLTRVSAFIPESVGSLTGYLNGKMEVRGTLKEPAINGYLQFDSAQVKMPTFGALLTFDDQRVPVTDGRVQFNNYKLTGANDQPMTVNGHVDLSTDVDHIMTNLTVKGKNVQIVSGKKVGKSELYGKGFIDMNAIVSGPLDGLDIKATMSILAGTNLTYVYQSTTASLSEITEDDVVKFVNFSDTVSVDADTLYHDQHAMRIKAALIIEPNAVFNVNLSPDGKNKVQIDGEGMLSYSQNDQGDISLIGRYAVNSGYVRYSPPMMSEKNFKFKEGSYLSWNGDLLNPTLNVEAVQSMKVNVSNGSEGSRNVPFDVSLNVGGTLGELTVAFDLSTDGDMTIANELSAMTAEQRAEQAMNLLLYNMYTGSSSVASNPAGGLSGNMAFSFLESMVNKWAASSIQGVDLSFGIDQQDKVKDGSVTKSTSYSYKVSKSVFDDRFSIAVGGNYVSDASAEDNLAQNLVNDISFEYKLNKTGTSNVKLFYHKEYESILEGEITEYGCGFVWKRKIASFRYMFKFLKFLQPKRKDNAQ